MARRTAIVAAILIALACTSGTSAQQGCAQAFINEIHYDNSGADVNEAVEVAFPDSVALSDLSVVLYNGAGGANYGTISFAGATASSAGTGSGFSIAAAPGPSAGIQNGAPDGVALVCGGSVIQFLSYEGVFEATAGPASGRTSVDIGVLEAGSGAATASLQLKGSGSAYADFTWAPESAASFGAVNAGQTFGPIGPTTPTAAATPTAAPSGSGVTPTAAPSAGGVTCDAATTPISQVQGSGDASPLVGSRVTVGGVVTASFQGTSREGLSGYFLQTPGDGDGNPATSEGLFVFEGSNPILPVAIGDTIVVSGTVAEFSGLTELTTITAATKCGSGARVEPLSLTLPTVADKTAVLEPFEGMLVTVSGELTVTNNFQLGTFGQVTLSAKGRVYTGTQVATPGAAAAAVDAGQETIVLDDGKGSRSPDPIPYPPPELSYINTLRTGATTSRITGALTYSNGDWRIHPTEQPVFDLTANARMEPPAVGGRVQISSFNVLNYFNQGTGFNGGSSNDRGANNATEFARQRAKIIDAITTIAPGVAGLTEIENDGYGPNSAIQDLIDGLNAATAPGTYAFREVPGRNGNGIVGTDAISVKFIYQPALFEPVGPAAIMDTSVDPRFVDTRNRPTLIQNWREKSSGGTFVFAINHLKSKGSGCGAGDDATDGSGNCDGTRTRAAQALVDYLATDPTDANDADVILMGDFNAYFMERPMTTLYDGGYPNLEEPSAYSYQFSVAFGSLDHAVASPSMASQITGAQSWHINADEPTSLDYNQDDGRTARQDALLYDPDAFRSSDHDPVIVGLTLTPTVGQTLAPTAEPTAAPTATPTASPTAAPTGVPTAAPTRVPTRVPTQRPNKRRKHGHGKKHRKDKRDKEYKNAKKDRKEEGNGKGGKHGRRLLRFALL